MKIAITMPVFRRPKYSIQTFDAVLKYLPEDWPIFVSVDRAKDGTVNQDVVNVFNGSRATVSIAEKSGGCNGNVFRALSMAWDSGADAVVCIEDDILLMRDAGAYLQWALETFKDDASVRNVTGWRHLQGWVPHQVRNENEEGRTMLQNQKFTCWLWATWRREWEGMKANWTTGGDDHDTSWDTVMERYWANRYEIAPSVSRATNIGDELGTHCGGETPPALADWESAEYWLDTRKAPRVFVILGAFGDIYMVSKHVPAGSVIACESNYASIVYELFPHLEVYEIDGVSRNDLDTAVSMCAYKYPNHTIVCAQQDGRGQDVVKPFRSYQQFQIARAKF